MQDEKEKLLKTLAERIAEEQQKKQGWEQTTLSGGLPGICLLLGKLMELYPDEERFVELARGSAFPISMNTEPSAARCFPDSPGWGLELTAFPMGAGIIRN